MTKTIMRRERSAALFAEARLRIPGGVNSPVRACANVGCDPVFYERAEGSRVVDVDGNEYVDFIGSWGPMILGHRPPAVLEAVRAQMERGLSFGAPCEAEVRLAERICALVPCAEMARMVSSGTEATKRGASCARFHGTLARRQVRRVLPWPLRRASGERGQRCGHARHPGYAGGDRGGRARHARRAYGGDRKLSGRILSGFESAWPPYPASPSRATWASCRPPPASWRGCARSATRRARSSSSTRSSAGSARRSAARRSVTA